MKKILIIEDDKVVANIYKGKYQLAGYDVQVASDGEMGLQLLEMFKPDLIQLDLMLPKISGVEVIKHIRAQPWSKSLSIVVMSNSYITSVVREAWESGANKCLSKAGCTPNTMLEVINKLLHPPVPANAPAPATTVSLERPDSASPPAPAGSTGAAGMNLDMTFQAEIRQTFLKRAPWMLEHLRTGLQTIIKAEGGEIRRQGLGELCRTMHTLEGNAGIVGFAQVAQMASALEALLKNLHEQPKYITASSLRTVAHAVDSLGTLIDHNPDGEATPSTPPIVLVVDDEILSRRAVCTALARTHLTCISVDDPQLALKLLKENTFSLIFLDVEMPGLDGFELCTQLRTLPANKTTPVVFVTSLSDFQSRTLSALSGGNDLIAKPFLLMELAVKALGYVHAQINKPFNQETLVVALKSVLQK